MGETIVVDADVVDRHGGGKCGRDATRVIEIRFELCKATSHGQVEQQVVRLVQFAAVVTTRFKKFGRHVKRFVRVVDRHPHGSGGPLESVGVKGRVEIVRGCLVANLSSVWIPIVLTGIGTVMDGTEYAFVGDTGSNGPRPAHFQHIKFSTVRPRHTFLHEILSQRPKGGPQSVAQVGHLNAGFDRAVQYVQSFRRLDPRRRPR